jgi:hypothetical protein
MSADQIQDRCLQMKKSMTGGVFPPSGILCAFFRPALVRPPSVSPQQPVQKLL